MTTVRPKLRDDCWYASVEGGLFLQTSAGRVRLEGSGLHPLLDRLAPHLDGTTSVDALVAGLPPAQETVVRQFLDVLIERGIARDVAGEREHGLAAWELTRYAQEIALADHLVGSAAYHFERFRLGNVLLVGAGQLMTALVRTMLRLGLRNPAVATTAEVPTNTDWYAAILAECRESDPTQRLTIVDDLDLESGVDHLAARLAHFDAVLHCSDRPMLGRAALVARAARIAGVPAVHALPVDGTAWVGPSGGGLAGSELAGSGLAGSGLAGGCVECAWRRLRDTMPRTDPAWSAVALADRPGADPEEYLSGPLAGMVAATLGFAHYRIAIGAEENAGSRMTRIDLETARTSEHRFHSHPDCHACRPPSRPPVAARVAALAARPATTDEELSRRGAELVDPRLGLLTELGEGDHLQLPLNVTSVLVADPTGAGAGPSPVTVVARDRDSARRRAVIQALELAAGRLAASSRGAEPLWDPVAGEAAQPPAGDTHRAVAAGFTWAEAVGRALLRLHTEVPILAPPAAGDPADGWRPLDPDEENDEITAPLAGFDGQGAPLVTWVRTGGPVVEASVRRDGEPLSRASALDARTATTTAVEIAAAVLVGHPVAGSGIAPDLGDTAWAERLDPLLRRLDEAGWRVLVAPVDSCPAITAALPFMAEVTVWSRPPSAGALR